MTEWKCPNWLKTLWALDRKAAQEAEQQIEAMQKEIFDLKSQLLAITSLKQCGNPA